MPTPLRSEPPIDAEFLTDLAQQQEHATTCVVVCCILTHLPGGDIYLQHLSRAMVDNLIGSANWAKSPCSGCLPTPCCRNMPVHEFLIEDSTGFDLAVMLLRYPRVRLGLKDKGSWTIYWSAPCDHLSQSSGKCLVHNTDAQPLVCKQYNPYRCWYRKAFSQPATLQLIMFDEVSLRSLKERCSFRADGTIDSVPEWEEMTAIVNHTAGANMERQNAPDSVDPTVADTSTPRIEPVLVMPPGRIRRLADLELIRFRLCFEGVSLLVSRTNWAFLLAPPFAGTAGVSEHRRSYLDPFGMNPDYSSAQLVDRDGYEKLVADCRFDASGRFVGLKSQAPPTAA